MTTYHPQISETIISISKEISNFNGTAYIVGGFVRDMVMNIPSKDVDIEVFGLDKAILVGILAKFGVLQEEVGVSFTATKMRVDGWDLDISIPRRERKVGLGHKAFEVEFDPYMSTKEAASRRDFTINAMMYNPLTGELLDHFGGLDDMEDKILRHTSDRFGEDPLRVLRAMQFASRFQFEVADETIAMCRSLVTEFHTISKERLWTEFEKLFAKGKSMTIALDFLFHCQWLGQFKSLYCTFEDVPMLRTVCKLADRVFGLDIAPQDTKKRVVLLMGLVLCKLDNPKAFLNQINAPSWVIDDCLELISNIKLLDNVKAVSDVRKMLSKLRYISRDLLLIVATLHGHIYVGLESEVADEDIVPKINGDYLKSLGFVHGKVMGDLLRVLYEHQLNNNSSFEELIQLIPAVK